MKAELNINKPKTKPKSYTGCPTDWPPGLYIPAHACPVLPVPWVLVVGYASRTCAMCGDDAGAVHVIGSLDQRYVPAPAGASLIITP